MSDYCRKSLYSKPENSAMLPELREGAALTSGKTAHCLLSSKQCSSVSRCWQNQRWGQSSPRFHSIKTMSVPWTNQKRRKFQKVHNNSINHSQISSKLSTLDLKLKRTLLNIRALAPKIVTDQNLTETWIRLDKFVALNEPTPSGYNYVHSPRLKFCSLT